MLGSGDDRFCRVCSDLIDVPAALKLLPDPPEENSSRLGRYDIVREISRGGGGAVYEARDPALDRRLALKVLDKDHLAGPPLRRFLREGRLLARIRHPNIVQIHELGRDQGRTFIAMEYVDGAPFPGSADRDEALNRLLVVARALDHLHRQGIVHRDLKPSNILVEQGGRPVLMDFGIARSDDPASTAVTATGAVLGTPGYMAPEQLSGDIRAIDARTDVYALGVILFEILTGRLPFTGSSVEQYLSQAQRGPAPGPRSIRKDVPRSLDEFCRRAISLRREDRPAGAGEFAAGLIAARSAGAIPWRSFLRPLAAVVLGSVLAASAVVALLRPGKHDAPPVESKPAPEAAWVREAADRKAKALNGTLGFDAAMAEIDAAVSLYRRAIAANPSDTAVLLALARLEADLGRTGDAHRDFDRILAREAGNLDALKGKGALIVTSQLELLLNHKAFPAVSQAMADRLADLQGRSFDDHLRRLPPTGTAADLARFYRALARSEFEDAKKLLEKIPGTEQAPLLDLAVQALVERTRPSSSRAEEDGGIPTGDSLVWAAIIRHLDRRLPKLRPAAAPVAARRSRLHAVLLQLEARLLEAREERGKAAEALAHATIAAPEDLQSHLLRARLLKEMGRREELTQELEAATRLAAALNLGEPARREIRSLS